MAPPPTPLPTSIPNPAGRLPAAERRRQLLDVAVEVFAASSFTRASMNDIAEAAGVTKPVLYRHFPSKRALFLEVLADVGSRLRGAVADATSAAGTPRAQVERGFHALFRFVAEEPQAFSLLLRSSRWSIDEFAGEAHRFERDMAELVSSLIEVPGMDLDHRRQLAYGIVGMADAAARVWLRDGMAVPPAELADRMAELAWAGLRGVQGHDDEPERRGPASRPGIDDDTDPQEAPS
ncbi:MAG TPA: TetR/AcrR family transcriptional regulator [Acidimicrobiales bacterium]|nr:TetR/AcrR family transcriptional regulator [Acidimicrobiales bacterium]